MKAPPDDWPPRWFRYWAVVCALVAIAVLAFGAWFGVEIIHYLRRH